MPYKNLSELPEEVRTNLPQYAQNIYLNAYNSAWKEYKEPRRGHSFRTREQVAQKVAWWAVENNFDKDLKTNLWGPRKSEKNHSSGE